MKILNYVSLCNNLIFHYNRNKFLLHIKLHINENESSPLLKVKQFLLICIVWFSKWWNETNWNIPICNHSVFLFYIWLLENMSRSLNKLISYFLLSLFISAITPDVFVHAFVHHEDSIDFYSTTSSFSHQHIHCDHLLDEMPASQLADAVHLPSVSFYFFQQKILSPKFYVESSEDYFLPKRGPPTQLS